MTPQEKQAKRVLNLMIIVFGLACVVTWPRCKQDTQDHPAGIILCDPCKTKTGPCPSECQAQPVAVPAKPCPQAPLCREQPAAPYKYCMEVEVLGLRVQQSRQIICPDITLQKLKELERKLAKFKDLEDKLNQIKGLEGELKQVRGIINEMKTAPAEAAPDAGMRNDR